MPEETPIDQRSVADPEPQPEPSDPKPPKRNRNNRFRNKRDPIQKDWHRVDDKDSELGEEFEDIGGEQGAKDNTPESSSANHGGTDNTESGGSEDGIDSDITIVNKETLESSPNGGKEEHVVVNSAPNGGTLKAAKGRWR